MLIYFVLIAIVCLDFFLENLIFSKDASNANNAWYKILKLFFKFRVLTICALVVISTFKSLMVGADTFAYYGYYQSLKTKDIALFTPMSSKFEIGFTFINSILALLNLDFRFLLFLVSLTFSICLAIFINKFSCNKFLSWVLYIMLGIFAQSISAMRQIIAMGLVLVAIVYLYDKKWIKSVGLILLASTFHISAIVCVILVLFRMLKPKASTILSILVITTAIALMFPTMLKILELFTPLDYYSKYFVNYTGFIKQSGLIDNLYSLALLLIFITFYVGIKKAFILDKSNTEKFNMLLLIYYCVPLIRILGLVCNAQALFNRLSMYFFVVLIVLIPLFVKGILTRLKNFKLLAQVGVYAIGTLYMIYLYAIKLSCGVVPFAFV